MTATGHAIIGTVIAVKIGNPALAIPLAVASHVAADAFPHWDEGTNAFRKSKKKIITQAVADVVLGFVLSALIVFLFFPATNLFYAFLMVIAAQALDWLTAPYYFFKIKSFKIFYKFQKLFDHELNKPWGIINQIAILVFILLLAIIL